MSNWRAKQREKRAKQKVTFPGKGSSNAEKPTQASGGTWYQAANYLGNYLKCYQNYYLFTCWVVHAFMWRQSKWRIQDKAQCQAAFRWIQKLVSPQVTLWSTKHTHTPCRTLTHACAHIWKHRESKAHCTQTASRWPEGSPQALSFTGWPWLTRCSRLNPDMAAADAAGRTETAARWEPPAKTPSYHSG